jgi:hypothetical protein
MTGECVDAGTVWQGWPSKKQIHVLLQRGEVDNTLYKVRERSASHASVSSSQALDLEMGSLIVGAREIDDSFTENNPPPGMRRVSMSLNSSRHDSLPGSTVASARRDSSAGANAHVTARNSAKTSANKSSRSYEASV